MDCEKCGARLELPRDGTGVVRCKYCGNETPLPGGWGRRPEPPPRPPVQMPVVPRRRMSRLPFVLPVIIPVVAGGFALAMTVFQLHHAKDMVQQATRAFTRGMARSMRPGTGPALTGPPTLAWRSTACPVDANQDGVIDFGGLMGPDTSHLSPTVIDGSTGKVLWQDAALAGRRWNAFCPSESWIGFRNHDQFVVELYPASGPAGKIRRVLSDAPLGFGMGDGCIALRSTDGEVVGLSLPSGHETHCAAHRHHDTLNGPGVDHDIIHAHLAAERAGVRYVLSERQRGTAFLEVAATRRHHTLWSVPLRFVRAGGPTGTLGIVATPGMVVVIGSQRTDSHKTLWVIGLADESGVERWATELPSRPAVDVRSMIFNQRYVVLSESWDDSIVALDPATGDIAWRHASH